MEQGLNAMRVDLFSWGCLLGGGCRPPIYPAWIQRIAGHAHNLGEGPSPGMGTVELRS